MRCAGRELVQQVAAQGCVIVTWANHHYLDFVLNWVHHLHLLGVDSYLVGAMDDALLQVGPCGVAFVPPGPVLSCTASCSSCGSL